MRDFVIVGGGIAGLAAAELLQRSGASVVLLEKNARICGESSAEQQGWFHTGALYAALPTDTYFRAMVGNLDDLVDYYRGFPKMNLRIDKHIYATEHEGWFTNRTHFYVYTALSGVGWREKVPWAVALYRAKRRMAWFENIDASRSLSRQMGFEATPTKYVVHDSSLGVSLPDTAFVLKSRDRPMDTQLIVADLLRSFLASGGELRTGTEATRIERGRVHVDVGDVVEGRHVIVTSGRGSDRFDRAIRTFVSPMLVVTPALTDVSFIRMSPHAEDTINHIYHRQRGFDYSLLGNAVYCPLADLDERRKEAMKRQILTIASSAFGDFSDRNISLYVGYKTELASASSMRNYLYHIRDTANYTLALPGKFSLCFSLAANLCRHFGIEPVERVAFEANADVSHLVAKSHHYEHAHAVAMERSPAAVPADETRARTKSQWPPMLK